MDKIICLGKNYSEHAKELGDKIPEKPVVFIKPPSSILQAGKPGELVQALFPEGRGAVHFETEIVLRISKETRNVSPTEAESAFDAVTLGLDLTLRDLQATLKKEGHPWAISKVFEDSAILGPWVEKEKMPEFMEIPFSFSLNGEIRQKAKGKEMIFHPKDALSYASSFFKLLPGDLLFTGTPKGVGPLCKNDEGLLEWGSLTYRVKWSTN